MCKYSNIKNIIFKSKSQSLIKCNIDDDKNKQ